MRGLTCLFAGLATTGLCQKNMVDICHFDEDLLKRGNIFFIERPTLACIELAIEPTYSPFEMSLKFMIRARKNGNDTIALGDFPNIPVTLNYDTCTVDLDQFSEGNFATYSSEGLIEERLDIGEMFEELKAILPAQMYTAVGDDFGITLQPENSLTPVQLINIYDLKLAHEGESRVSWRDDITTMTEASYWILDTPEIDQLVAIVEGDDGWIDDLVSIVEREDSYWDM